MGRQAHAPRAEEQEQAFIGYKRHIAADLDTELILACAITPANRPEEAATPDLQADIERLPKRAEIGSLHIDRGYIGSSLVKDVLARRGEVLCKPWVARNRNLFTKADFVINMRNRTIECPAGEIEYFQPGSVVEFDPDACGRWPQRARCTMASPDSGRTISIAGTSSSSIDFASSPLSLGPTRAPRTCRCRASARTPRRQAGPPRALHRDTQAPLRRAPRRRRGESRDYESLATKRRVVAILL